MRMLPAIHRVVILSVCAFALVGGTAHAMNFPAADPSSPAPTINQIRANHPNADCDSVNANPRDVDYPGHPTYVNCDFNGSDDATTKNGFWLFSCQVAGHMGYTGQLNNSFEFGRGWAGDSGSADESWSIGNSVSPAHRAAIDATFKFDDSCTSASGGGISLRVEKTGPKADNRNIGYILEMAYPQDSSLAIKNVMLKDDITNTKQNYLDSAGKRRLEYSAAWSLRRSRSFTNQYDAYDHVGSDFFRGCFGSGLWADVPGVTHGYKTPAARFGLKARSDRNLTVWWQGSWYDKFNHYDGVPPTGNAPDNYAMSATNCHIYNDDPNYGDNGSSREWYWFRPSEHVTGIAALIACRSHNVSPTDPIQNDSCMDPNAPEVGDIHIASHGTAMFIHDAAPPSAPPAINIAGRPGGGGWVNAIDGSGTLTGSDGALATDNNDFARYAAGDERITFPGMSDESGIRRVEMFIDGSLRAHREVGCNYTYRYPCFHTGHDANQFAFASRFSGVSGADAAGRSLNPKQYLEDPFFVDLDGLRAGTMHTVTIRIHDASGKTSDVSTTFGMGGCGAAVDANCVRLDCGGNVLSRGAAAAYCEDTTVPVTTGMPGAPVGCNSIDDPSCTAVCPPMLECGAGHSLDSTPALFTYTVCSNPGFRAPFDLSATTVGKNVIGGMTPTGASRPFNDRELNRIISVTIDLRAFAGDGNKSASVAGLQNLRSTFSIPSRNNLQYRQAIGCANSST